MANGEKAVYFDDDAIWAGLREEHAAVTARGALRAFEIGVAIDDSAEAELADRLARDNALEVQSA
jgi:hypothetical protein